MPTVKQSDARKKDFYVVRNGNTDEVVKVVFPNGIQVGLANQNFNGKITLSNLSVAPEDTENAIYAVGGTLYFNGAAIGGGGGGGAPVDAQYLTLSVNSTLTGERVLVAGTGLTLTDGGAGGNATLNIGAGTDITVNANDIQVNRATLATAFAGAGLADGGSTLNIGAGTDITVNANDIQVNRATLATAFAGSGLTDAGSSLAVNPGTGIKIVTDAVAIDDSIVATVSGTAFSAAVSINGALKLTTQVSAPAVGSNEAIFYVLDSSGTKKLYFKNSDNVQVELGGASSPEDENVILSNQVFG